MILKFRVPHEEPAPTLLELIERAWPEGTDAQRAELFEESKIRVDERIIRKPGKNPHPDATVVAEVPEGKEPFGLPEADSLSRGEGWVVVNKAVGMPGEIDREDPMHPVFFLADMLGLDRETFSPVWEMPTNAGGPWLFGVEPKDAKRLRENYMAGRMMMTWVALVPAFGIPRGQLTDENGIPVDYGVSRMEDGLWEVQLTPQFHEGHDTVDPMTFFLELLATKDAPVVGDRKRGGYMVDGGLRLRLAALYDESSDIAYSWPPEDSWWPEHPVVAPPEEELEEEEGAAGERPPARGIPTLQVSEKTLEVLEEQRHPWVLADSQTGSRDHLHPGTLVRLRTERGRTGPYALVEGTGNLAARVWSHSQDAAKHFGEEIDIRIDEAFARRSELLRNLATTDLFRLIHGEADGLPGLHLDRVGPVLRATVLGGACEAFRARMYENITDLDPGVMILEVRHEEDVRRSEMPTAEIVQKGSSYLAPGERVVAQEDGFEFWCEPWEGIDVGFFADQRDNRRKLKEIAEKGQRWLNLFCHTGAFSVALASEGASVVSVDLSKRYLEWLEENLELNELDPALNESVAQDAREYLADCDDRFHGIVVDPPTAASSEAGFWSVRKDYEDLLVHCFERLESGGVMLVCRNAKRAGSSLEDVTRAAARRADRKIESIEEAPPSPGYPHMPGFPEGDSFEGLLVHA